jgi:hypothetical protein
MHALRASFFWVTGQSIAAYAVRGLLAIGLIAAGFMLVGSHPALGMALMFSALIPLGGCPGCWLGGMIGAACAYKPPRQSPTQD